MLVEMTPRGACHRIAHVLQTREEHRCTAPTTGPPVSSVTPGNGFSCNVLLMLTIELSIISISRGSSCDPISMLSVRLVRWCKHKVSHRAYLLLRSFHPHSGASAEAAKHDEYNAMLFSKSTLETCHHPRTAKHDSISKLVNFSSQLPEAITYIYQYISSEQERSSLVLVRDTAVAAVRK